MGAVSSVVELGVGVVSSAVEFAGSVIYSAGSVIYSAGVFLIENFKEAIVGFYDLLTKENIMFFVKMMTEGPSKPTVATTVFTSFPKKKHTFDQGKFNFAFIGEIGVGKSSLINGFRGIQNSELGAASVGDGQKTSHTTLITSYEYENAFIRLSDVPGAGTDIEPLEYFLMWDLYSCDGIIAIVNPQLTDFEEALIRFLQQGGFKSRFVVVMSKGDKYENAGTLKKVQMELKNQLESIQEEKGMKKYGSIPFYIVSSSNMHTKGSNQFDHVKFFEKIVELGKARL